MFSTQEQLNEIKNHKKYLNSPTLFKKALDPFFFQRYEVEHNLRYCLTHLFHVLSLQSFLLQ